MIKWFKNNKDSDESEDKFTKRDFWISIMLFIVMISAWNFGWLMWDKTKCAYQGHILEKDTKRPIFSTCLIQMKDGSYVPLEKYFNRVITLNDMNSAEGN